MPVDQLVARVLAHQSRADYYGVLGLQRGAAAAAMRKRYLALALRLHPDQARHKDAQKAFTAVHAAFRILFKSARR